VNVSIANAIRRTLLSDIPIVVFKTSPFEESKARVIANTSRLNDQIILQRLSCVPIHLPIALDEDNDSMNIYKNYSLELNVENLTDTMMYVTTENFKIKDKTTNKYLSENTTREIFPPDDYTGMFIEFLRLRPKISNEIPGEKIHLTCEFAIGTAKDDGMFNVVSTASYGCTVDINKQQAEIAKKVQTWKNEGKKDDEIKFEIKNWEYLDGKRVIKQDSFDFTVQTIGIYTNHDLLTIACKIIMKRLHKLHDAVESDEVKIETSKNTLKNSFDITLVDDDYTIGKVIEYMLNDKFYKGNNTLTYCGYLKPHPHDPDSIIRVAYVDPVELSTVKLNLIESIRDLIQIYQKNMKQFDKLKV
jgi:DNA-directed RNA polymerase subunit L